MTSSLEDKRTSSGHLIISTVNKATKIKIVIIIIFHTYTISNIEPVLSFDLDADVWPKQAYFVVTLKACRWQKDNVRDKQYSRPIHCWPANYP